MRPLLAPNLGGFSMKQASVSSTDQGGGKRREVDMHAKRMLGTQA